MFARVRGLLSTPSGVFTIFCALLISLPSCPLNLAPLLVFGVAALLSTPSAGVGVVVGAGVGVGVVVGAGVGVGAGVVVGAGVGAGAATCFDWNIAASCSTGTFFSSAIRVKKQSWLGHIIT